MFLSSSFGRSFCAALLFGIALMNPAQAEQLSLERIYGEPSLIGSSPRALRFAPDGKSLTFLRGKPSRSEQLDLWSRDLASGQERLLVDSNDLLRGAEELLSDEEKARRERMRIATLSGIVEYQFSAHGDLLLFPLNGSLYVYDLKRKAAKQLTDAEQGFVTDPKFSPKGSFVSFVRAQNLWILEIASGKLTAITSDGGGLISNGMAEFVAQEEMSRQTGYWWSPDERAIAFARVDESKVPVQRRFEIYAERAELIEQRYPAAGTTNASVQLFLYRMDKAKAEPVDMGADTDIYLARLDFRPNGKSFLWQRQSRDQQQLSVLEVELSDLSHKQLWSEQAKTWVNLHDNLRFLKDGDMLWTHERGDLATLERRNSDGAPAKTLSPEGMLVEQVLAVDEARGTVYVSGSMADDRLSNHIYALPLKGAPKSFRALSKEPGRHDAVFAPGAKHFLLTRHTSLQPPSVALMDLNGKRVDWIEANALDEKHSLTPYLQDLTVPEFGELRASDGTILYTRLIKPKGFDPSKRYPVLVYHYGGPHVQVVHRGFDARWGLLLQYFAQRGMVVFSIDNRGSARRGKAFEDAIYGRMGRADVDDQALGLRWLHEQSWVDEQRIAVFGWSYGGYMALMIASRYPELISASVAVAPVSDWLLYDTHYTERYMDLPARNAEGYQAGDVLSYIDRLDKPLLLIHGMADDNVLFSNATRVMAALQNRGQAFELMTYPGGKHGINASQAQRLHVYQSIDAFLARQFNFR